MNGTAERRPLHVLLAEYRQRHADRLTCCACGCDLGFPSSDPYADPDCRCCERRSILGDLLENEPDGYQRIVELEHTDQYSCPTLAMLEPLAAREPALPPEPPATEFEVPPY